MMTRKSSFAIYLIVFLLLQSCATTSVRHRDPVKARQVVAMAQSMQGIPYRYGGSTPKGFDCSGLVQYVYKNAIGLNLPRTSAGLFAYSKSIPIGLEKPADLLFFKINGRKVSHVGIYLGKGKFIHAPSSGKSVKISNANANYWRKRFAGVRRVIR